ncbi:MAG: hypothetical protein NVS9B5_36340 [Terriglobales bacterium]
MWGSNRKFTLIFGFEMNGGSVGNAPGILHRMFGTGLLVCLSSRSRPAYLLAFVLLFIPNTALAQSNAEWTQYKSKCGIPASTAYNDWVAQGSPCHKTAAGASSTTPAVPALNPEQQLGMQMGMLGANMIGQGLHQLLFGPPATKPGSAPSDPAQQQRELAAQQLNNSGLYLLKQNNYTGAINEFQQALTKTPNDQNIIRNLALARQQLKDGAVASQTSGALGQILGMAPVNAGHFDFDQLTHSSVTHPNASVLNLLDLNSDASVVDLRSLRKTSIDPEVLKRQLDGVLANNGPASAPPNPLVVLPQVQDIELLFQPPQSTASQLPGPQRPASDPKLINPIDAEQQTKVQVEAIFGKPGGLDDILLQKIQDDAIAGITKTVPASPQH